MRTLIATYLFQFLIDIARELADRTSTTIDDDIVDVLEENTDAAVKLIVTKFGS